MSIFIPKAKKLQAIQKLIKDGYVDSVVQSMARVLANAAIDEAPILTGKLVGSIRDEKDDLGYQVIADDPAAIMNEYGTMHMTPQPFMRVIFERKALKLVKQAERSIKNKIKATV